MVRNWKMKDRPSSVYFSSWTFYKIFNFASVSEPRGWSMGVPGRFEPPLDQCIQMAGHIVGPHLINYLYEMDKFTWTWNYTSLTSFWKCTNDASTFILVKRSCIGLNEKKRSYHNTELLNIIRYRHPSGCVSNAC